MTLNVPARSGASSAAGPDRSGTPARSGSADLFAGLVGKATAPERRAVAQSDHLAARERADGPDRAHHGGRGGCVDRADKTGRARTDGAERELNSPASADRPARPDRPANPGRPVNPGRPLAPGQSDRTDAPREAGPVHGTAPLDSDLSDRPARGPEGPPASEPSGEAGGAERAPEDETTTAALPMFPMILDVASMTPLRSSPFVATPLDALAAAGAGADGAAAPSLLPPRVFAPLAPPASGGEAASSAVVSEGEPTPGSTERGATDVSPGPQPLVPATVTDRAESPAPAQASATLDGDAAPVAAGGHQGPADERQSEQDRPPAPAATGLTAPVGGMAAGALGPASSPASAAPAAVGAQVFPEVARLVTRGDGTHRITLSISPEALGDVRVVLTVRGGEVHVSLTAGPAAQQALTHGSVELARLLERVGATATQVVVNDVPVDLGHHGSTDPDSRHAHPGAGSRDHQDHPARTRGTAAPARDGIRTEAHQPRSTHSVTSTHPGVDVTV